MRAAGDAPWNAVERLFAAVFALPPDERALLLARCEDAGVRREVERLLRRHDALEAGESPDPVARLEAERAIALLARDEAAAGALLGRHRIIRVLGRGSMATVYLAWDATLEREVAVKVLSPHLGADAAALRRFREEARIASALEHPHVAAVHEIGETAEGRLYIVMGYCSGGSLRERLGAGRIPVDACRCIGAELADGLAAAHARGIVHRDIKPENILFGADGGLRIGDFGIAKVLGRDLTRTGATLGTAAYMSPEQTRGEAVDARSDVWSAGVVLYEMLAGRRPFEADAGEALVYAIRHDAPRDVRELEPAVPPWLGALVARCLEKDPADRPPDAAWLATALRSGDVAVRTVPTARSHRQVLVRTAAALALVGTAGVGLAVARSPLAADGPVTLAVLPFADSSARRDQAHLGAGVTEDVTILLAGIPGLRVSARDDVVQPREGEGALAVGRRLGVASVFAGSIARRGDSVRLRASLLRTADGRVQWQREYARAMRELGALQHQVVTDAARALRRDIGRIAPATASTRRPIDPVAYDLYMRGRLILQRRDLSRMTEAAEYFREALAIDSTFARAWAALADVYASNGSSAPTERYRRSLPLTLRALALDSTLGAAHRTAGWYAMWYDRDWPRAERHLRRALELDPTDIWVHHSYAAYLSAIGRSDSSMAITRRATSLDPVSAATATHVGLHLFWMRRYRESIAVLESTLASDTTWPRARTILARAYLAVGRHDEAIALLRKPTYSYAAFEPAGLLANALGVAGRTAEARRVIADLEARASAAYVGPVNLVAAYLGVGDTESAMRWMERVPDDRGALVFPLTDPLFDPLRGDPRFQRVLERLNLGPAARDVAARAATSR